VLLIDQQAFIVALIGAVELLLKFVLRNNRQQSLRIHSVDVCADVFDV
jgi:hypothetical protein